MVFNERGYKTEERTYQSGSSRELRRITYTYDESAALIERSEYQSYLLVARWQKTFEDNGYTTTALRYNDERVLTSEIVQRYDAAGKLLSDIATGADGTVISRWELTKDENGSYVQYSPSWGSRELTRFDSQGRIAMKKKYRDDTWQLWEYQYSDSGNLLEGRYESHLQQPAEIYGLIYDSYNRLTEISHKLSNGDAVSRRRYSYSAGGILAREVAEWFDREGAMEYTWTYQYDPKGNLLEKAYRHEQRPFSARWTYRYDTRDRVVEERFWDTTERPFTALYKLYDSKGAQISEERSGRGADQSYRKSYEYDAAGRMIESVQTTLEGEQISREAYRYNTEGDLVESARYNADDSLATSTRYTYVYDENGNWVQKHTYSTNNAQERYDTPTQLQRRTITYYD
jgi:hypothetical protein